MSFFKHRVKYSFYWKCKYCNLVNNWKDKTCSHCGSLRGKATVRHTDKECFTEYHPTIHREIHNELSLSWIWLLPLLFIIIVPFITAWSYNSNDAYSKSLMQKEKGQSNISNPNFDMDADIERLKQWTNKAECKNITCPVCGASGSWLSYSGSRFCPRTNTSQDYYVCHHGHDYGFFADGGQ